VLDYEQQRQHLLHKHGIDLEDSNPLDKNRPRRMDRKDIAALMGGDGTSGVFTWRERHRRKVSRCKPCFSLDTPLTVYFLGSVSLLGVSTACHRLAVRISGLTDLNQVWHKFLQ
jgi:hypothetical protein